jgi:uncharacterized phage protein gp47/JayE
MASVFVATRDIVQSMCDDFKNITGVTLTPDQIDDPRVVKFWTDSGPLSSVYSTLQQVLNNFFPSSADTNSLRKHLLTRNMPDQIQPQKSHGQIQFVFSTPGTDIPVGTQVKRKSNGALFQSIQDVVVDSTGQATIFFESMDAGSVTNIIANGEPFQLVQPIVGVTSSCVSLTKFLDGRDLETNAEMVARILAHDQDYNSGGNIVAYETWAKAASNEVVTAKGIKNPRGLGTVNVIITSGTTDIQGAVQSGQAVTRQPSTSLVSTVLAYINTFNPVTDDVQVMGPTEVPINVSFSYSLYNETVGNRSYVNNIITQTIQIFLYSARPMDVLTPTQIERAVDLAIGDLIDERECGNLGGSTSYYQVGSSSIVAPGTITLTQLTTPV